MWIEWEEKEDDLKILVPSLYFTLQSNESFISRERMSSSLNDSDLFLAVDPSQTAAAKTRTVDMIRHFKEIFKRRRLVILTQSI